MQAWRFQLPSSSCFFYFIRIFHIWGPSNTTRTVRNAGSSRNYLYYAGVLGWSRRCGHIAPPRAQATFKSTALIGSMDESNILLFYSHPIRANLKKIHLLIGWETGIRISINVLKPPLFSLFTKQSSFTSLLLLHIYVRNDTIFVEILQLKFLFDLCYCC